MQALPHLIGPGDHSIDIGCHLGIYSYHLLALSAPGGTVTAFEPQPELADYLSRAFARETDRFILKREALGSTPGRAQLTLPREGTRLNRGRASLRDDLAGEHLSVEVAVLDALDLPRPQAFIKCDVEGFELEVLTGAQTLLRQDHPTLLVEIERQHVGAGVRRTFDFLRDLGYDAFAFRATDGAFGRIAATDPEPPASAELFAGGYVYNYVFMTPDRAARLPAVIALPGT